ncbi:MAG: NAD(+) kinase [Pseudomonadales bacterium]|nr:NAD(+) kinase [Pseudomonadales bacterium]
MSPFRRIGVVARLRNREVVESLDRLVAFLKRDGREVIAERDTAELLADRSLAVVDRKTLQPDALDLVIVVGGDGSMLGAIRALAGLDVPLLGLNRGRLGFLTDIPPEEMETGIGRVLAGEYQLSERFLLQAEVWRQGVVVAAGNAANDVVLHPGRSVRMMEFELYVDGQFVYSQHSDGLIVATPTGSTAYALSAGGPILQPQLHAIVLVPLNPHSLNSRPIVIGGDSVIEIRVGVRDELRPAITCDGQYELGTGPDDVIRVRRQHRPVRLIHPVGHNFYQICRTKLGWGSRLDSVRHDDGNGNA